MYEFDPANSSDPAYPALYTTIDLVYCKCGRCTVHIVHTRVSVEEFGMGTGQRSRVENLSEKLYR